MKVLRLLSGGRPGWLAAPLLWNLSASVARALPHLLTLLALYEMLRPLQDGEPPLRLSYLLWLTLGLVIALIIQYYAVRQGNVSASLASFNIGREGRLSFGEHLRKLSLGFFQRRSHGDTANMLVQDFSRQEQLIYQVIPNLMGALGLPVLLAVVMVFLDWRMTVAMVIALPAAAGVLAFALRRLGKLTERMQSQNDQSANLLLDYLDGLTTLKLHNAASPAFLSLRDAMHEMKTQALRTELAVVPLLLSANIVIQSGFVFTLLFGSYWLAGGTLSAVSFVMFLLVATRFYEPFLQLLMDVALVRFFQTSIQRLEDVRRMPVQSGELPFPEGQGDLVFHNVSFAYEGQQALRSLSFTMPAGSVTALVGPSGSGKTTVTRLLARFWEAQEGVISIGGIDLNRIQPEALLSQISMVFQDVYLFQDTILHNLAIGRPDASREQIIAAARQAQCHDFIMRLPQGYDTIIGEGGSTLSGGEKQRLSIARALLKDTPIVILDEATASLDPEHEGMLRAALQPLLQGKTVLIIAHRLYTIASADQIVVMNKGAIEAVGTHETLMARGGTYAALWHLQQRASGWSIQR